MIRLLALIALCYCPIIKAEPEKTLVVQSHDISYIYGTKVAESMPRPVAVTLLRNSSRDRHDGRGLMIERALSGADFTNLILIGFEDSSTSFNPFGEVYAQHIEKVLTSIGADKNQIHTVCNTLCLGLGKVHITTSELHLRKLLSDLNRPNTIIINSLTNVWSEDKNKFIEGDELASKFRFVKGISVSALQWDGYSMLQFRIRPEHIAARTFQVEGRYLIHLTKKQSNSKELERILAEYSFGAR